MNRFRIFYLVVFSLTMVNCKPNANNVPFEIQIVKIKQHPFLVDHCKQLTTVNTKGEIVDTMSIYCDPGTGCISILLDSKRDFILVDCNSQCYNINKKNGTIERGNERLTSIDTDKMLGTFVNIEGSSQYVFVQGKTFEEEEIFKYNDPIPNDY